MISTKGRCSFICILVNCVLEHAGHTDRQIVLGEISMDDGVFVCLFLPWLSATLESIVTIVNPSCLQLLSATKEQATNCSDEPHLKLAGGERFLIDFCWSISL